MSKARNVTINFLLVAASLAISLGLCEIMLRVLEPFEMRLRGTEIRLATNHTKVIENQGRIAKLAPVIRHSKNAVGFRGDDPPRHYPDYLTIIAIGGSTTECFYLSDGESWPEVMSGHLKGNFSRVWVNNAGLDGHSSFGHAYLLRDYLAPIAPKIATFLVGVNDVGLDRVNAFDDSMLANMASNTSIRDVMRDGRRALVALSNHSHVVNLSMLMVRSALTVRAGLGHGSVDFANAPPLQLSVAARAEQLHIHRTKFAPLYEQRLMDLIRISESMGIRPVLITQPALWGRGIDPTTGADLGPASDFFWDRLEIYNDVTRSVAAALNVSQIDLARKMRKDSQLYYDWIHFTKEGAREVARIVAEELKPVIETHFPEYIK